MAQVGGTLRYNASAPVCQVVTADSAVLKVDVSSGAPVAQVGMSKVLCYVQTVGESSLIAQDGVPYSIGADGTVTGFTAESGKQYKVWYFINKASAQLGTITSMMNPKVLHWTMQMPVYANANSESNGGTRVGWLYAIVPMLKLNGDGGGVRRRDEAEGPELDRLPHRQGREGAANDPRRRQHQRHHHGMR